MAKQKSSSKKTIIIILIIIAVAGIMCIPNFKLVHPASHENDWYTGCSKDIAEVTQALKEYNSVNPNEPINELNRSNIYVLKSNKFLSEYWKSSLIGREKCKYLIKGDITKDGFVYCEYHGSVNYNGINENGDYCHIGYYDRKGNTRDDEPDSQYGIAFIDMIKEVDDTPYHNIKWKFGEFESCKYDINKVKIPPSNAFYRDIKIKKLKNFLEEHIGEIGLIIGIIGIIITIFA